MQSTVTTVFFGYPQKVEVLTSPILTLFSFTGLRGTMPGAPAGLGAVVGKCWIADRMMSYWKVIDYVGILPCLALTAMCVRKVSLISCDISIHFDIRLLGISLSWSVTMSQQSPGLILYTIVSVCNRYHHSFRILNVIFLVFLGDKIFNDKV